MDPVYSSARIDQDKIWGVAGFLFPVATLQHISAFRMKIFLGETCNSYSLIGRVRPATAWQHLARAIVFTVPLFGSLVLMVYDHWADSNEKIALAFKGANFSDRPTYLLTGGNKIHELCEITTKGEDRFCTLDRLREIIKQLKEKNRLEVLNAVPLFCQEHIPPLPDLQKYNYHTPLQYWASKGNLEAVKLLFDHGALDYCPERSAPYRGTSALYVAALAGHCEIVDYLLEQNVGPDIAFRNNNVLRSFIPSLIFEMHRTGNISIECLEKILEYLSKKNPDNFYFQLKIPVDDEKNITRWIEIKLGEDHELYKLLVRFGGREVRTFCTNELRTKFNVGVGFTLYGLSSLK